MGLTDVLLANGAVACAFCSEALPLRTDARPTPVVGLASAQHLANVNRKGCGRMSSVSETHRSIGSDVRPFSVGVSDEALEDLRRRIAAARWPTKELVDDRSQGVQLDTVQALARYWTSDYDWRACEARLNALPQFTTEIDGLDVHFIHVRSRHEDALPLIMTH